MAVDAVSGTVLIFWWLHLLGSVVKIHKRLKILKIWMKSLGMLSLWVFSKFGDTIHMVVSEKEVV